MYTCINLTQVCVYLHQLNTGGTQYMVLLGLSGIILFAVSVAALSLPDKFRGQLFERTWKGLSSRDKQVSLC